MILLSLVPARAIEPLELKDDQLVMRYDRLVDELRCLVCQNQSLADSDALLARDMRSAIIQMLNEDATDEQIITLMTDRYGDFVLLRPRFSTSNLFLWLGPLLILLIALASLPWLLRAKKVALDPEQQEKARQLLDKGS